MDWASLDFENVANGLLILIVGLLSFFGIRGGKRKAETPQTAEIAGALVDASSVNRLTAAIEAANIEQAQNRADADRSRKVGHELVEAVEEVAGRLDKLEEAVQTMTREMIRKR